MIRLRTPAGELIPVPENAFVEILDQDDNVGLVFFYDPKQGRVDMLTHGTPEAARYAALFNTPFVRLLTVPAAQKLQR